MVFDNVEQTINTGQYDCMCVYIYIRYCTLGMIIKVIILQISLTPTAAAAAVDDKPRVESRFLPPPPSGDAVIFICTIIQVHRQDLNSKRSDCIKKIYTYVHMYRGGHLCHTQYTKNINNVNSNEPKKLVGWTIFFFFVVVVVIIIFFLLPRGWLCDLPDGSRCYRYDYQKKKKKMIALLKILFRIQLFDMTEHSLRITHPRLLSTTVF